MLDFLMETEVYERLKKQIAAKSLNEIMQMAQDILNKIRTMRLYHQEKDLVYDNIPMDIYYEGMLTLLVEECVNRKQNGSVKASYMLSHLYLQLLPISRNEVWCDNVLAPFQEVYGKDYIVAFCQNVSEKERLESNLFRILYDLYSENRDAEKQDTNENAEVTLASTEICDEEMDDEDMEDGSLQWKLFWEEANQLAEENVL